MYKSYKYIYKVKFNHVTMSFLPCKLPYTPPHTHTHTTWHNISHSQFTQAGVSKPVHLTYEPYTLKQATPNTANHSHIKILFHSMCIMEHHLHLWHTARTAMRNHQHHLTSVQFNMVSKHLKKPTSSLRSFPEGATSVVYQSCCFFKASCLKVLTAPYPLPFTYTCTGSHQVSTY